jgi:hypothetical protein
VKDKAWQIRFGLGLVVLSALLYVLHFVLFRDAHHIMIYLVGDIAFVPIEVLLVTLIIHQLLTRREKMSMLSKLNMVIGVFFSDLGTELLHRLSGFDSAGQDLARLADIDVKWDDKSFAELRRQFAARPCSLDSRSGDLAELRRLLLAKRPGLMDLLRNGNLLEHQEFTDMLWAVFHLADELERRAGFADLPQADLNHLTGDLRRAHQRLVLQWLDYMRHLKADYPYLFSLAIRSNPFRPDASPVIEEA